MSSKEFTGLDSYAAGGGRGFHNLLGTFSDADFCDGDGDRESNLFRVDVVVLSPRGRENNEFPLVHKTWVHFLLLCFKYLPFLSHLVSEGFKTN